MIIKTITCHDVYNAGASLQAYALMKYLSNQGHDVEIIDYKPDYLSRHYSLSCVNNPRFDVPVVKQLYLLAKLPSRLAAKNSIRKKNYDKFKDEFLKLTERQYHSFEELDEDCPKADIYIAGSDQIWNPILQNGKDPVFFLEFVKDKIKRCSYAASFSVDRLENDDKQRMNQWLKGFGSISVRESTALNILNDMGLSGEKVCDPVFLLSAEAWEKIAVTPDFSPYIFVYDFDNNKCLWEKILEFAKNTRKRIVSVFPNKLADIVLSQMGPREFLGAILNADYVISNSFHATAFSLIFQKEFSVTNRKENLNVRMIDLLNDLELADRFVDYDNPINYNQTIDWKKVRRKLLKDIELSELYLNRIVC